MKKSKLNSEKIGKIWKKGKLNGEMIGKIWKKYDQIWKVWKKSNLFKFTLCPTIRGE